VVLNALPQNHDYHFLPIFFLDVFEKRNVIISGGLVASRNPYDAYLAEALLISVHGSQDSAPLARCGDQVAGFR
jgi:hypothetical protein